MLGGIFSVSIILSNSLNKPFLTLLPPYIICSYVGALFNGKDLIEESSFELVNLYENGVIIPHQYSLAECGF